MLSHHDPLRQVSNLWDSLSHDKRPLGLFLGAGCPLSVRDGSPPAALIPDIAGLTKIVGDKLSTDSSYKTVVKQLAADGVKDPNIEHILSHIRALSQVAGKDSVRSLNAAQLCDLDKSICEQISAIVNKNLPGSSTPYHRVASWIGAISRSQPVQLFTTNYDLLMEQALEHHRVPYFDGFIGSYHTFFDPCAMEEDVLPPRWARLWKLHGSINWYASTLGGVCRNWGTTTSGPSIIHPSHLKYDESRRMPYLAMLDRLKNFLKQPSAVLVVSGYSFSDEHLNELLVQGLQGNPSATVFAMAFSGLANYEIAVKLASNRANLSLLARDGGVIGTKNGTWNIDPDNPEFEHLRFAVDTAGGAVNLKLGDFAAFGEFLGELIGSASAVGQKNGK
jgi:hypothetical protein